MLVDRLVAQPRGRADGLVRALVTGPCGRVEGNGHDVDAEIDTERDTRAAAETSRAADDEPKAPALYDRLRRRIRERAIEHALGAREHTDGVEVAWIDEVPELGHEPSLEAGDRNLHV